MQKNSSIIFEQKEENFFLVADENREKSDLTVGFWGFFLSLLKAQGWEKIIFMYSFLINRNFSILFLYLCHLSQSLSSLN